VPQEKGRKKRGGPIRRRRPTGAGRGAEEAAAGEEQGTGHPRGPSQGGPTPREPRGLGQAPKEEEALAPETQAPVSRKEKAKKQAPKEEEVPAPETQAPAPKKEKAKKQAPKMEKAPAPETQAPAPKKEKAKKQAPGLADPPGPFAAWSDAFTRVLRAKLPPPPGMLVRLVRDKWREEVDTALFSSPEFSRALSEIATEGMVSPARTEDIGRVLRDARKWAKSKVKSVSNVGVVGFGSTVQGTALETSDLDLTLIGEFEQTPGVWTELHALPHEAKRLLLRKLGNSMRAVWSGFDVVAVLARERSRFALAKVVHRRTGIPVDFSVGNEAPLKSLIMREILRADPRIRPLLMAVKRWAKKKNINDAASGTLSTFALNLLTVFHLQNRPVPVLPPLWMLLGRTTGAVTDDRPLDDADLSLAKELTGQAGTIVEIVASRIEHVRQSGLLGSNTETLGELFFSFITEMDAVFSMVSRYPTSPWGPGPAPIAADPWTGQWVAPFPGGPDWSLVGVLDPFLRGENVARAVRSEDFLGKVAGALHETAQEFFDAAQAVGDPRTGRRVASLAGALLGDSTERLDGEPRKPVSWSLTEFRRPPDGTQPEASIIGEQGRLDGLSLRDD